MSLAGCGGDSSSAGTSNQAESSVSSAQNEDVSTEEVQEETEAPTNIADVGDYHVEIKSAALAQDYEGNPAVVITYSWTNNSEDTTSPMVAVSTSVFQNGVGMDSAIIGDDTVCDSMTQMTEVRPGTTIDVQEAFSLSDTTSPIEVEIGEWLTLEEDPAIAYMEFDLTALAG